jgi:hypothetical protein
MPEPRFHISTGPASLFERVRFKISAPLDLDLNHDHYKERQEERSFMEEFVRPFRPNDWELVGATVTAGSGKFIESHWRRKIRDDWWHLVIGMNNVAITIIRSQNAKNSAGDFIVKSGPLYDKVAKVNADLMMNERE